jgi:hypothetical protein
MDSVIDHTSFSSEVFHHGFLSLTKEAKQLKTAATAPKMQQGL